jgi:16S rRNA (uracil1498-N3)-methyltransferase
VRRFTIAPERIRDGRVVFDRDESRHLARVLRLRSGDTVLAADGAGREYTVRLESVGEEATGTVLASGDSARESPVRITLLQGVPKGDRMESIVRACTELGVARIVPVLAERTIVTLEDVLARGDDPDLRLCLWEGARDSASLPLTLPEAAGIALLVGPEGGFAASEVDLARQHGWLIVGAGPRILRTETAGPAIVAVLQARFGDLGGRQ